MWTAQVQFLEDEDETALKARFVELCAMYPNRDVIDVGTYIFSSLREPGIRGAQAAMQWSKDLDIQERIRLFRLNGGHEAAALPTKEQIAAEILALARNDEKHVADRLKAYQLHAEVMGHIVKKTDNKSQTEDKTKHVGLRQFIIREYDPEKDTPKDEDEVEEELEVEDVEA